MNTIPKKSKSVKIISVEIVRHGQVVNRYEIQNLNPTTQVPGKEKRFQITSAFRKREVDKEVPQKSLTEKQKINKILDLRKSSFDLVRVSPCKEKPYTKDYVRKNLTRLRKEIFERFEHYLDKEKNEL